VVHIKPIVLLLAIVGIASAQDHSYTQGDLEEGAKQYRKNCIGCHGGEGASVTGIDLGRGKFKIATSDEDLVRIIQNGVPGTGMPATAMGPYRAAMIVAYLRNMNSNRERKSVASAVGDVGRGKTLFENQGKCSGCHRIRGVGGRSGPDLSEIGHVLRAIEIESAIVDPDAQYPFGTRPVRVERKEGPGFTGSLLNQDRYSVQLLDQEGQLRSLDRSEVKSVTAVPTWMPSYSGKFNAQELADLIAYVGSLRGAQ